MRKKTIILLLAIALFIATVIALSNTYSLSYPTIFMWKQDKLRGPDSGFLFAVVEPHSEEILLVKWGSRGSLKMDLYKQVGVRDTVVFGGGICRVSVIASNASDFDFLVEIEKYDDKWLLSSRFVYKINGFVVIPDYVEYVDRTRPRFGIFQKQADGISLPLQSGAG